MPVQSNAAVKPKKNGKIELLRFVFALFIVLLHTSLRMFGAPGGFTETIRPITFSPLNIAHGAIGVEFFFLVSGFLMAKKVYGTIQKNGKGISADNLVLETWYFEKGKVLSIFPYHIVSFVLVAIGFVLVKEYNVIEAIGKLAQGIPTFLLTYVAGTATETPVKVNPPLWYLSAMLIAMPVIYPVLRKFYRATTRVIGPVVAVGIMAWLFLKTGSLNPVLKVMYFTYQCLLRGAAEILLGCTAFEICRWLESKQFSKAMRVILTIYEVGGYAVILLYSFSTLSDRYGFLMLALLFSLIALTFSGQTYGNRLFNNRVCYFLGGMSLNIYLVHMFPVFLAQKYMQGMAPAPMLAFVFGGAIVLSFVVSFGGKKMSGWIQNAEKKKAQKQT